MDSSFYDKKTDRRPIDTYFQSFSSGSRKILPVGVGNSLFNLDIEDNGNIEIQSHKSRKYRNNEKYTAFIPSLPLDAPNPSKYFMPEDFTADHFLSSHKEKKVLINEQFERLKLGEFLTFHESLYNLGAKKFYSQFLDASIDATQLKLDNYKLWQLSFGDIADIPKEVVEPLLGASILCEKENFENNYQLKNCLANYEIDGRNIIFCPTGPLLDKVAMKEILIDMKDRNMELNSFKMLSCIDLFKIDAGFHIKEIICFTSLLYIRGDYQVCIYCIEVSATEGKLIIKRRYKFDDLVHSIGVNNDSNLDFFVVFEDQSIYQLVDRPEPKKVVYEPNSTVVRWQTCIYGSSRETCLVSNSKEVLMYDFRIKNPVPSVYFDASSCSNVDDKLTELSSAMMRNPSHQHQYFMSNNYNILLCDERYLKRPVLQFNHYLDSPPYFMQMFLDGNGVTQTEENSYNALLLSAAYRTADSVIHQMFSNGTVDVSFGAGEKLKCSRPATVSLPYKLSNYSDWRTYVSDWRFSLKPYERLNLPCIGVSLTSIKQERNTDLIYFIQQSLCGDLFFQQMFHESYDLDNNINELMQENSSPFNTSMLAEKSDNNLTLNKICKKRCSKWMDSICVDDDESGGLFCVFESRKDDKKENKSINTENKEDITDENFFALFEKETKNNRNSFVYDNPSDVFMTSPENIIEVLKEDNKDLVCTNGIEVKAPCFCANKCSQEWLDKVFSLRNELKILTRESLGLPDVNPPPEVNTYFERLKFHERPLNQVLRAQWDSEDYVSLNVYATDLKFDVEQYL